MINANIDLAAFEVQINAMDVVSIDWSGFRSRGVGAAYEVVELSMMSAELSVSHV